MGTSPDVGGSRGMGRPQTLDYQEQAQTAQVTNLKAGMGMVNSTLEIPLTQVGVGAEPYRYEAHSSKPNLDTKVLVEMQRPEIPEKDPREGAEFQKLLDKLPLQLSLQLQSDRKKPFHERNPKFIVFDMILRFVAKALVWLESVSQIDSSQHSANISKTEAFPHATLRGWIEVVESICDTFKSSPAPSFMTPQGMRDVKTNFEILKKILGLATGYFDAEGDDREKLLVKIEKELMLLGQQVKTRKIRGLFLVTENLIEELTRIMGTLKHKTSACALIGMIRSTDSFVNGKTLIKILTMIAEAPKKNTFFQKQFLPHLMALISGIFPTLTYLASGKKRLHEKKDPRLEKESIQSLAVRLASCLIAHSGLIPYVTEKLFYRIGIEQKECIAATEAIAMNVLVLNADVGLNNVKSPGPLMDGIQFVMVPLLEYLREVVGEHKTDKLMKELNTGIRQAGIALKREGNSGGYFEAIKRILKPLKLKYPDLRQDCAKVTEVAVTLLKGINETQQQIDYTKIVVQAA